jgi:cytochrome P450
VLLTTPRPRGPKNLPVLGNLHTFGANPLRFLTKIAREYGDVAYFRLGRQDMYLVNHPELIREILVTNQENFTKSRALQRSRILLGQGLLTSEGPHHAGQRRLVQPAFHRERLADYARVMSEYAVRLRDGWKPGATLDISEQMSRLTLSVVAKTLFSADMESKASEIGEAINTVFKMLRLRMIPFSEYLEKLPLPSIRRFEQARARLEAIVYGMIRARRENSEGASDLLSMLLLAQAAVSDSAQTTDDAQVRDEALTLLIAGHETTAQALTWTWYLLSKNPEPERRLHEEIESVLQGRVPTFEDLPRLRYTEMVFAEALRLYPPAWAFGREAKEAFKLAGIAIAGQSICVLSPYVVQRDSRWFRDPERFDPERWSPEARESRPKFSYFPFGGGARVCIGERFASMEGVLSIATLAQKWRFRLAADQRVEPLAKVTLRTKHGMRMMLEPRF